MHLLFQVAPALLGVQWLKTPMLRTTIKPPFAASVIYIFISSYFP